MVCVTVAAHEELELGRGTDFVITGRCGSVVGSGFGNLVVMGRIGVGRMEANVVGHWQVAHLFVAVLTIGQRMSVVVGLQGASGASSKSSGVKTQGGRQPMRGQDLMLVTVV